MNLLKRFSVFLILASFAGTAFALEITGQAPTLGTSSSDQEIIDLVESIQGDFDDAWETMMNELDDEIGGIKIKPSKIIKAFADTSVYTSQGASQRAFGDYKLFAFTLGPSIGVHIPSSKFRNIVKDFEGIEDKVLDEGDLDIGLNIQMFNGQISINTSKFLVDRLYLGFHFGYFNLRYFDDLTFKTTNLGPMLSFQFIKGFDVGVFRWRGITATSGIIYQSTKLGYRYDFNIDPVTFSDGRESDGGLLQVDPRLVLDMNIKTCVIPLEVNTAVQLLWFLNMNMGFGVDLAFGKNSTSFGLDTNIDVSSKNYDLYETGGYLRVRAGGTMHPKFFNPKFMFNPGFKFGPVVLDIPISYYFARDSKNVSLGVTLGAVW